MTSGNPFRPPSRRPTTADRDQREHERATRKHLPEIPLTARSREEDRQRSLGAGMDAYLAKPVGAAELVATIERVAASGELRPSRELLDQLTAMVGEILVEVDGLSVEKLRSLTETDAAAHPHRS